MDSNQADTPATRRTPHRSGTASSRKARSPAASSMPAPPPPGSRASAGRCPACSDPSSGSSRSATTRVASTPQRRRTPVLKFKGWRKAFQSCVWLSLRGRIYKRHFRRASTRSASTRLWSTCCAKSAGLHSGVGQVKIPPLAQGGGVPVAPPVDHRRVVACLRAGVEPGGDCHGNVKDRMRDQQSDTVEEIEERVNRGFKRLRRRPDLLLSILHHVRLGVNQFF
jgi:hypothetical protein